MIMTTRETGAAPPVRTRAESLPGIHRQAFAMAVLLLVQYGLGIGVNLFVTLPRQDHGAGLGGAISNGPAAVSIHAVLGLALIVTALGLAIRVAATRRGGLIALAILGMAGLTSAAINGTRFAGSGQNGDSMAMAWPWPGRWPCCATCPSCSSPAGTARASSRPAAAFPAGQEDRVMVAVIEIIVLVVLLAAVGGRLLGVRLPLARTVLAGLAGVAAGVVFGYLVWRRDHDQVTLPVVGAGVLAAVVAMMLVMVLAELLARPSRRDLVPSGMPHPWRALRRMAQNTRRSAQLTKIAARHGLASPAVGRADPGQLARRLRPALEEAGPIFVKLGQVLSTRTDLLPLPVTTELAKLQDQVPPAPWPQIQALLSEELGGDPGEVFKSVDPEPLASASLAQAHAARRSDGTAVILKVQRPGIDEQVSRDLEMIRRLTRRAESQAELARAWHVGELGRGFADALADPSPGTRLPRRGP